MRVQIGRWVWIGGWVWLGVEAVCGQQMGAFLSLKFGRSKEMGKQAEKMQIADKLMLIPPRCSTIARFCQQCQNSSVIWVEIPKPRREFSSWLKILSVQSRGLCFRSLFQFITGFPQRRCLHPSSRDIQSRRRSGYLPSPCPPPPSPSRFSPFVSLSSLLLCVLFFCFAFLQLPVRTDSTRSCLSEIDIYKQFGNPFSVKQPSITGVNFHPGGKKVLKSAIDFLALLLLLLLACAWGGRINSALPSTREGDLKGVIFDAGVACNTRALCSDC